MAVDIGGHIISHQGTSTLQFPTVVTGNPGSMGCRNAGKVGSGQYFPIEDASIDWNGATWDTTNDRFTAQYAGWYAVWFWGMTDNDAVYGYAGGYLVKNGGSIIDRCWISTTGAYHHMLPGFCVTFMNVNDYVRFYITDGEMYGSNQRYARLACWKLG